MRKQLSIPQWRLLENHRLESEGHQRRYFPRNRSQAGAWSCAYGALVRKGFIHQGQITDAGRKALEGY